MVTLTPEAVTKVSELLDQEAHSGYGLRLYVTGGGCGGFSYGLAFSEAPHADDEVLDQDGVRVFIDPESAPLVDGAVIDFVDGITGTGFAIKNPNARSTCGCGHSFSTDDRAMDHKNC